MPSAADWLFLMLYPFILAAKACDASLTVRETDPLFRQQVTQRQRYGWNILALVVSGAALVFSLGYYGWDQIKAAELKWWHLGDIIGYMVVVGSAFVPVVALIALLGFYWIHEHPSKLGRSAGRKIYYLTADIRAFRRGQSVSMTPVRSVKMTVAGLLTKHYEYVDSVERSLLQSTIVVH